ncbi:MAG: dihydropteroate synthase [Fusobacteria bacterium]|nr:MAG: dihydropteroate synthase [Fusobacteriota bacterium]KAF0230145.1 MAG: dihydropteroate [Fusobacteriota bacterium]
MIIGNKVLDFEKNAYIMGILNITPDSFSDGGEYFDVQNALEKALEMESEGASIIDIGGESTRPGAIFVEADVELKRIIEPIKILTNNVNLPISVDTYKGVVAEAVIKAGASMINDIMGLQGDKRLGEVVAYYQVPICVMMNRRIMETTGDILKDLDKFMMFSLNLAKEFGIKEEKIIVDPGIGFGISANDSFRLINNIGYLKKFGRPILLGASRKRIVWETLKVKPKEGIAGTLATTAIGVFNGANIIRVHDVKENVDCARLAKEILNNK